MIGDAGCCSNEMKSIEEGYTNLLTLNTIIRGMAHRLREPAVNHLHLNCMVWFIVSWCFVLAVNRVNISEKKGHSFKELHLLMDRFCINLDGVCKSGCVKERVRKRWREGEIVRYRLHLQPTGADIPMRRRQKGGSERWVGE